MFMTIPDAARELGVAPSTLRRQIKLGKLGARKIGLSREWFVHDVEVQRYAREHRRRKPETAA